MSDARAWPLPAIVAHRCGGKLAPENTLAGLNIAAALGCEGVEFDVMLSGDGTPVLIHDETLERTTNGVGPVAETSDACLRRLDAGSAFAARFAGEPIPELAEAMARCAALGLAINLEIKPAAGHDLRTGKVVGEVLRRDWSHRLDTIVLSSFSEAALAAAAAEVPGCARGLLVERVPDDWQSRCERLGAIALHAEASALRRDQANALRAAGLRLAVYTENDPARAEALLGWGIDSVITDWPDRFRLGHAPTLRQTRPDAGALPDETAGGAA